MAYFHCLIGGGSSGGGYELTVTCDADFAGTTITCTDGVTTLTQTCPSVSPYEVVFAIPNGGTWTVSGIVSGSTCTASIDIPDELELIAIPDGSTVTPTDDIQTWLKCGGILDKSYTTLNEVLADSTTLLALMSDDNASDYLVRSTTWASGITADSTAMTDIGANNYCANTLLSDSTWAEAICNSTYFENVLNVKVPTMTSDTTPSGVVSGTTPRDSTTYARWKAFDGDNTTQYQGNVSTSSSASNSGYLQYEFASPVSISCIYVKGLATLPYTALKVEVSSDGSTYETIYDETGLTLSEGYIDVPFTKNKKYVKVTVTQKNETSSTQYLPRFYELQFYGRADV